MTIPVPAVAATTTPTRRRISWDALRVLCVFLVVLYHATSIGPGAHPELIPRRFEFPYQVGASMLLLVSAYFACASIRKGDMPRYWWNRIARLLPPFLAATVIAFVVMRLVSPTGWFVPTAKQLAANLLMLWNWKPQDFAKIDESLWTVPLQLMAFTLAALLWRSRWGHGRALRVVLWVAVLVPIAQWPYRIAFPPESYRVIVDGFGFHRFHLFVAGVAIWLWAAKKLTNGHFAALIGTCMTAHALHSYVVTDDGALSGAWGSTIGVWIGMLVVIVLAHGADVDRLIPKSWAPTVSWLAGISYGVFLMHQTIGYILMRHLQDLGIGPSLQTAAMMVQALLLGWLLTRLIEQPVHRGLLTWFEAARTRWTTPPALLVVEPVALEQAREPVVAVSQG
ncbi:MAG: acyltransferase family protein [Pseudonocardiaceae bacterium]